MPIKYAQKPWGDEKILKTLKPYVAKWFKQTFETFTPPQKYAIPLIQKGENTLVFSPTGSGKCITPDQKVLIKIDGLVQLLKGEKLIQIAKTHGKVLLKTNSGVLYEVPNLKVFSLKENKIVESPAYIYIEDYRGEIIEIETVAGRKIKITPNHPLLKEDINGTWKWVPAEKLKVGDRIAVAREINYQSSVNKLKLEESLKVLKKKFKEVLTYKDYLNLKRRINVVGFEKLSLEELNQVRIFCKLKYAKIAKETGIGLTTVWNFFRGKTSYKRDVILKNLKENFPNSVEENRIFVLGRNGDIISFKYPKKIDEKLVKWVAFVLSEGHIQASSRDKDFIDFMIIAQAKNKKLLREFLSITRELFDMEFKKKDEVNWVLNSRVFLEFISVYLDLQPNSRERRKRIPDWILSLDKSLMRIFLRWFFTLDADIRDQIVLFQASEDIIDKIAYMLLRFGIFPSLNVKYKFASNTAEKKKRKYYSVSIFGIRNLRKFHQEIGLERELPASYINLLKAKPSGEHIGKFYLNFKEISEIRKILGCSWHGEFEKRYGNIYEVVRRTGMITLAAAQKLQGLLKQDLQKLSFNGNVKLIGSLRRILESEIFFLKIKKINKIYYEGKLLDFTVPGLRNFIGGKGAVILHNTLAAFLFGINWLFELGEKKRLKDSVYVVYVSPLRALANDIRKNLLIPLEGIRKVAKDMGLELPEIRAFVRTGDTPASEKAKMLKKAPHILITTPETLSIVLCAPRFREKLRTVRYVIVDEVHELCDNKRGVHLSLSLERLQEIAEQEFIRIGLSATQAPLEEIAKWLVGYRDDGKLRDVTIVNIYETKKLDMRVICPVRDLIHTDYTYVNTRMYEILRDLVEKHRTTLIFTNTRSGAESVTFHLKQVFGEEYIDQIATHHGSLSRTTRLEVEDLLKQGRLKAVITSTSLELGIDIGYIDLVVQIGSPKSVAKGLQRVGRAGHFLHEVSKGRLIVFDRDDLVECTVLVKAAYEGKIDRVQIPKNCLDVLAQHLVGMSVNRKWKVDEAYKLVKRSYCYHNLPKKDFLEVLKYLGGYYVHLEDRGVYRKLWYDEEERVFGRKRAARMIYFMNIGTIPDEADFRVILEDQRTAIGMISEKFLERLIPGDIFVLGGKTYQYLRTKGNKVIVRSAYGRRPTVPQWVGEMLPRSFDLSIEVGKFRELITKKLKQLPVEEVKEWLKKEYYLDEAAANSIVQYFIEQLTYAGKIASHRKIILEEFFDERGRQNIVFHAPFGRRTNDALSRAYAYQVSKLVNANVGTTITDDGFMLILPYGKVVDIREIPPLVTSKNLIEILKRAIRNTELFRRRFQHVATRSFMILRKYKGHEISLSKQQFRASKILDLIADWEDFPIVKETYREILEDVFDVENAKKVLQWVKEEKTTFDFLPAMEIPSPFAHGTILVGISDIVMMEDRQALLKELHQKILEKIQEASPTIVIERKTPETLPESIVLELLKERRTLVIRTKEDIVRVLHQVGAIKFNEIKEPKFFKLKGFNDLESSKEETLNQIKKWIWELEEEGKIIQVPCLKGMKTHYIAIEDYPIYATAYQEPVKIGNLERKILDHLRSCGEATINQIIKTLKIKRRKVNRALKNLEKAYLVHRKRRKTKKKSKTYHTAWYIAEEIVPTKILLKTAKMNKAEAQKQIILKFLYLNGPSTLKEIANYTGFPQDETSKILSLLEAEGVIERGRFVDYKPAPQIIIKEDLEELRRMAEITVKKEIIPTEKLEAYYKKIQHLTEDTKGSTESDILKILEDCGPMYTLVNRTPTLLNRVKIPREEVEKIIKKTWKEIEVFWVTFL
ncbi:MAG: ATP-dependent helicase [Candidatus Odinarchaeota archaeon]|nr:ATP-dependent helicase [Candidatus Odinarchaeota archaeon]